MTLLYFLACSSAGSTDSADTANPVDTGDTAGDTADTGSDLDPVCTEPVEPACLDELIQSLSLHDDKTSKGDVTTTADGTDFVTLVDATTGGSSGASKNAWTYVKFTSAGAEKLSIDDESALEDMTWALGLRRWTIRLNSGDSGPSCVGVKSIKRKTYADVTVDDIPAAYDYEDFFSESCDMDTDRIGGPLVVMTDWWGYDGCVSTSDVPWVIQLADGHVIKLVVEAYYADDGQEECETLGSTDAEAAWIKLRWSFLR